MDLSSRPQPVGGAIELLYLEAKNLVIVFSVPHRWTWESDDHSLGTHFALPSSVCASSLGLRVSSFGYDG